MKIAIFILHIIALALIVFNATKIDYSNPLTGESIIALITILSSLCVIFLLQILKLSKRIEKYVKKQS